MLAQNKTEIAIAPPFCGNCSIIVKIAITHPSDKPQRISDSRIVLAFARNLALIFWTGSKGKRCG